MPVETALLLEDGSLSEPAQVLQLTQASRTRAPFRPLPCAVLCMPPLKTAAPSARGAACALLRARGSACLCASVLILDLSPLPIF